MKRITEEEAWALDEEISKDGNIEFGPNGTGFLSMRDTRRRGVTPECDTYGVHQPVGTGDMRLMGLNDLSVKYLMTKAEATRKSPGQIVNDLIRKELKAAV